MSDVEKIVEVLGKYEKFCNEADAPSVASLYASDAILLPGAMMTAVGSEGIGAFYAGAFGALQLTLKFDIPKDKIIVTGEYAFATTSSTGTRLIRATGDTIPEINRELWIFQKVAGDWKIARYMFNKSE